MLPLKAPPALAGPASRALTPALSVTMPPPLPAIGALVAAGMGAAPGAALDMAPSAAMGGAALAPPAATTPLPASRRAFWAEIGLKVTPPRGSTGWLTP